VSRTNRATQKALLTSGYCAATPGRDAAIVLEIAAGGSASCDASDAWTHADVSGGGCVTSLDALMILQAGWVAQSIYGIAKIQQFTGIHVIW